MKRVVLLMLLVASCSSSGPCPKNKKWDEIVAKCEKANDYLRNERNPDSAALVGQQLMIRECIVDSASSADEGWKIWNCHHCKKSQPKEVGQCVKEMEEAQK